LSLGKLLMSKILSHQTSTFLQAVFHISLFSFLKVHFGIVIKVLWNVELVFIFPYQKFNAGCSIYISLHFFHHKEKLENFLTLFC
jgi:hypothetical protein